MKIINIKRPVFSLIAGASLAMAALSLWAPGASAQVASPGAPPVAIELPLNRLCVVTVDRLSHAPTVPVVADTKSSGFTAPDTVEGTLVRLDADWVVLKDGNYENWIPRGKVLMMRAPK